MFIQRSMWEGVVEDIQDPLEINRVRVRVFGLHTNNKTLIPTESLPWAIVVSGTDSASVSGVGSNHGLVNGTTVIGYFRDGENAQEPVILGTLAGIPESKENSSNGFSDPTGTYPRDDLLGESDVNRLARGNKDGSVHEIRESTRQKNVNIADGGTWEEPATPFAAKYPDNQVDVSKSGHTKEVDNTEGSERIHESHKSGTGYETFPDGTQVYKVVKDNYSIVLGDDFVYVDGTCNIHVKGETKIYSGGKATIEAPEIDLGVDGREPMVMGDQLANWILTTLKPWLDTHSHYGNLGFPTSPALSGPLGPFLPKDAIKGGSVYSKKNRTQK